MIRRILTITVLILLICSLSDLDAKSEYDDIKYVEKTIETITYTVHGFVAFAKIVESQNRYDIFIKFRKPMSEEKFIWVARGYVTFISTITKECKWSSNYLYILGEKRLWRIKTSDCRKATQISKKRGSKEFELFIVTTFERLF